MFLGPARGLGRRDGARQGLLHEQRGDRGPHRGQDLLAGGRLAAGHALGMVHHAAERDPELLCAVRRALLAARVVHEERDRAAQDGHHRRCGQRGRRRVALHVTADVEQLPTPAVELADERAELVPDPRDVPRERAGAAAILHAIRSFAHRRFSSTERRVAGSGSRTRLLHPRSPATVPMRSTARAKRSAATQPRMSSASASANTPATSRRLSVRSAHTPATPRPLAIRISARTCSFTSALARATSVRARRLAFWAISVTSVLTLRYCN